MISSRRQVGINNKLGVFKNKGSLLSTKFTDTFYTVENSQCKFVFKRDLKTGLSLYSFQNKSSSKIFYNKSKSLWKIGMTSFYNFVDNVAEVEERSYNIYPSYYNLADSDIAITQVGDDIILTAIWKNIKYDRTNNNKVGQVTFTATLPLSSSHMDMEVSIRDVSGLFETQYTGDVLYALGMPSLAVEPFDSDVSEDVMVIGVQMGECIKNPVKYFESPRWENESIQFKQFSTDDVTENYKYYKAGSPAGNIPQVSTTILNVGNPGWMYTPLAVFGNRTSKDGFLYCAIDSDGCHAKNFQTYSNGKTLNFRFWDISDEIVESNGVGGKDLYNFGTFDVNELLVTRRSRINTPGWKVRIRPFVSPTKWVDWESIYLYKQEVMPVLENYGWMATPFYTKYLDNEVSLADIEIPFYISTVGHITGDAADVNTAAQYYREWYSGLNTIGYVPRLYGHVQEVTINTIPRDNEHFGWETWATGQSGVDAFLSPDFELNAIYSGSTISGAEEGTTKIFYLIYPYAITSGSVWTQQYSGQDLVGKGLKDKDKLFTYADYSDYANGTIAPDAIFREGDFYNACFSPQPNIDKYVDIVEELGKNGGGAYNDTCGLFGAKGCFAQSHSYYDPITSGNKIHVHPKNIYSHYFNKKQIDWLKEGYDARTGLSGHPEVPNSINPLQFLASAEYSSDSILKYCPAHIPIDFAAGSHLKAYYRNYATDPIRTDLLNEINIFGTLNAGARKRDQWHLAVPVFQILYGDRSITTDWVAPVFSNLLDASGEYVNLGPVSGYDSNGSVVNYPLTHEQRVQELRHIACTTHNYFNKFLIQHQAIDFTGWDEINLTIGTNARFSGYSEDHSTLLDSAQWSGYKRYTQDFLKTQIIEPDYLYHGTMQHPLDDYLVDTLDAGFSINVIRDAFPNFLESTGNKEEVIYHAVRKHRNRTSLLFTISNWTSGTYNFSGTFDPLSYSFQNAYYVYEVDLSGEVSTKTQLTYNSLFTNYEFNFDMPGATTRVFEIQQEETILTPEYDNFVSNYQNIRYRYDIETLYTNDIGIAYAYGSQYSDNLVEEQVGCRAAATQQIANNLPPWMKMRQDQDSCGWALINSWGCSFEEVLKYSSNKILETTLETADESQVNKVSVVNITQDSLLNPTNFRNLLFNSGFSIKDVIRKQNPAGWTDYNKSNVSLELDNTFSFLGTNSIKFNTMGSLTQSIEINKYLGSVACSVYCRSMSLSTDIKLIINVELIDGTSISKQASIISKSIDWKRLVLPIEINNDVYKIHFTICSSANANICAPMLEYGSSATPWTASRLDSLPVIRSVPNFNSVVAETSDDIKKKIPIFPINDEIYFLNIDIPTRIEKCSAPKDLTNFYKNQLYGRRVTFEKENIPTQWIIKDNKIVEISTFPGPYDVFERYELKELRFTSNLEYGRIDDARLTIKYLDTLIINDILYILCEEQYLDNTIYTIKLCYPKTPASGKYLQCFADFRVNVTNTVTHGLNEINEKPTSILVSNKDPSLIAINTNTLNRVFYKLYFDYYYFNPGNGSLYTREHYKKSNIKIL